MALKVFEDTFRSQGKQWEGKAELPVDTEILIPDYLPQVFKVVKCLVYMVLLQKNVSGARLHLEGYLRCVVLYQAEEEGSLCRTEQKLPFERTVDLPDESFSHSVVETDGSVEYINCRAVNQRRIELRGGYILAYHLSGTEEMKLVTALADEGIEQRLEGVSCTQLAANLDKLITNEEDIQLPAATRSIVDISGSGHLSEKKLLGGKGVFKGNTTVRISFFAEGEEALRQETVQVGFHQIVDIEGLDENSQCTAEVETIGCMVTAGADGASVLTVTSMLHISVYNSARVEAVCDAFSTSHQTETEYRDFSYETVAAEVENTVTSELAAELPGPDCVLLGVLGGVTPPVCLPKASGSVLTGQLQALLLYKNALGEYGGVDASFPYQFAFDGACRADRFDGSAQLERLQWRFNEGKATLSAQVALSGIAFARESHTMLASIGCGDAYDKGDGVALRIYYASEGERVFDIAKRYHARPKELMGCNQLEGEVLTEKKHILIPSAN